MLPLRKAEEKTVIFPCEPFMQASEMRHVVRMARGGHRLRRAEAGGAVREGARPGAPVLGQVRELAETLPVLLLLLLLCGLDWALYSVFDTIRHHSFLQYSFRSEPRGHPARPAQCHLLRCLGPP